MNVLSTSIKEYNTFQLKQCREIKFSNGGHLFACAVGPGSIHIFNFYTSECPQNMQCKGHVNKVRCIDWFDDDMGFTSCGIDGNAYCYDLSKLKEDGGTRNSEHDFNQKGVSFTGLCNIPNKKYEILLVGSDKKIYHIGENKSHCDVGTQVSQVNILHNGKAFFAALGGE